MLSWKDEEHKIKFLINILRHDVVKGEELRIHTHDFVEMEYILGGSGIQLINGTEYPVSRGDLICFSKTDNHTYYTDDLMSVMNIIIYYSVYEEMSSLLKSYMPDNELTFPLITHLNGQDMLVLEDLILKAEEEFLKEEKGVYLALKSYLSIFLVNLCRIASNRKVVTDNKLSLILEYIDKNFSNISISRVAKHFGYSANYFSKFFKNNFGISFVEYVNKKRLNQAIELLTASELTVDDICFEVGFKDKKHFYDIFQKAFGTTPAKFRKG